MRMILGKRDKSRPRSKETQSCFRIGVRIGQLEGGLLCAHDALTHQNPEGARRGLWQAVTSIDGMASLLPEKAPEISRLRTQVRAIYRSFTTPGKGTPSLTRREIYDQVGFLRQGAIALRNKATDHCFRAPKKTSKPKGKKGTKSKPRKKKGKSR